mgnify:FL=1
MGRQHAHTRDFEFNPMGTDGFAFVEFAAPDPNQLRTLFHALGFRRVGHHISKPLYWYQQGNIRFLISEETNGFSSNFKNVHGPSACAMGFTVNNAKKALNYAKRHHADPCQRRTLELQIPAIYGIGDSLLYLVDEQGRQSIFNDYFEADTEDATGSTGLLEIDHLTHNVHQGHMDQWANFYEDIFNFHQIRYFDIKGKATGLVSRAMTSPCGKIRIPINESTDKNSQIEEYLQEYNGEGIQHIALTTKNIYRTVEQLKSNGIQFLDVPDTYYEMLEDRLPQHGEDIEQLQKHKILVDGATEDGEHRLLLQIFTDTVIGPIFFEIIQRKGDEGFGEGNFQALFESIERDQIERGVLKV